MASPRVISVTRSTSRKGYRWGKYSRISLMSITIVATSEMTGCPSCGGAWPAAGAGGNRRWIIPPCDMASTAATGLLEPRQAPSDVVELLEAHRVAAPLGIVHGTGT